MKTIADNYRLSVSVDRNSLVSFLSIVFLYAFLIFIASKTSPGNDWSRGWRPATLDFLSGRNPYENPWIFNPPWVFVALSPMAVLPEKVGSVIVSVAHVTVFAIAGYKLRAKPILLAAFLFSPHVLWGIFNPNIDWLVLMGIFMPPQIGLFFVLAKPQLGLVLSVLWTVNAFKEGGIKKVLSITYPVAIAFLLSFLFYGLWPLRSSLLVDKYWNMSLWPYGILPGIILAALAIAKNSKRLSVLTGPLLSPYVGPQTTPVLPLMLLPNQIHFAIAIAMMWIVKIVTGLPLGMNVTAKIIGKIIYP